MSHVSLSLPERKFAGKKYMKVTLQPAQHMYNAQSSVIYKIAFNTFAKCRPKHVKVMEKTPYRQCVCKCCENFKFVMEACNSYKLKGIQNSHGKCVDDSMCMYHPPCVTCGRNVNNPACQCKVQSNNLWRYSPKRQHAFRNCKECGVANVKDVIEKENVDALCKTNIIMKWKQWLWESSKGKNGEITRALN